MYGSSTENVVCGDTFKESFETYETFFRCIFVQQERKFYLLNPHRFLFLMDDFENRFYYSMTTPKKITKKYTVN